MQKLLHVDDAAVCVLDLDGAAVVCEVPSCCLGDSTMLRGDLDALLLVAFHSRPMERAEYHDEHLKLEERASSCSCAKILNLRGTARKLFANPIANPEFRFTSGLEGDQTCSWPQAGLSPSQEGLSKKMFSLPHQGEDRPQEGRNLDATKVEISTEAAREQHNGAVLARAHAWPQAGAPSSGWVANQATLGVTQV